MTLSTLVEMDWLLTSMSAHGLKRAATSLRVWQQAMQNLVFHLRGLSGTEKYYLPHVDVQVISDPPDFTAIDSSAVSSDTVMAPIDLDRQTVDESAAAERVARVKACSSLPEIWRSDYGPGPLETPRTSGVSSSSDDQMGRQGRTPSLLKAQTTLHNSVQLLFILQRYAERLTRLPPNHEPPSTSAGTRVSLNVKMIVENVTASLTQRKRVTPLLVKRRTIGPRSKTERAPTSSQPATLDRFGRRAMRKLESWVDEGETSDAPKLKTESPGTDIVNSVVARAVTGKRIRSNLERLNDEGNVNEGATVNSPRVSLLPEAKNGRTRSSKNSRTRSSNNLRDSLESSDGWDESLLPGARKRDLMNGNTVGRAAAKAGARPVQDRMAEVVQIGGSTALARSKNNSTHSLNDLSHSNESNNVRDEFLLTESCIRDMVNKSVAGRAAVKAGARPVQDRMAELLQTGGSRLRNEKLLEQPNMLIHTLERIVDQLVNIETKYVEIVAHARQDAAGNEAGVEWLSDDDLTAKLQKILKRQTRRRGIDLS